MTDYCNERTSDGPRCRERMPCPIHQEEPLEELEDQRAALAAARKSLEDARKVGRK